MESRLPASEIAADARTLRRNVLVNAAGYVVKLGMPVLLAFGTRTYGAAAWGVFVALQALVIIAMRVAVLGLDKALLWWIPSRGREGHAALRPAIATVVGVSLGLGAILGLAGEPLLRAWTAAPPAQLASLRIMLLGLAPAAATELLLHASMGERHMEANVIVRETLVPAALIGFALILHACGVVATGLAWAYLLASVLGLIAALHYQPAAASGSRLRRLPRELFAYAVPLWLAEIANSSLLRLSILVVAAFADPVSVGVWGIVTQFATAMRAIRTAFDPIVTVIAADIARNHDARRLSAVLSYSAQLVSLSQFPLFAFLLVFADLILPLYGPAFGAGALPLIVLCSFWLLNGAAGLAGVVVTGYGRSKLTLLNTLGTIAAQLSLLLVLVPRMGLVGGAIAVGASYSFQHVFQLVELKRLTGGFQFSSRAAQPLLPAAAGGLGAALVHGSVGLRLDDPWLARSLTFSTFLAIYAAVTLWYWRRGELRAPE